MNEHARTIPVEVAREIAREAEVRLNAVLTLATAQDARAMILCATFGAASVAIAAAVLAYLGTDRHSDELIWSGAVSAFLLFVAAVIAAYAGAPRNFWLAGGMPADLRAWAWDRHKWRSEAEILDATAQRLDGLIRRDGEQLELETRRVRRALWVALASIVCGLLTYAAARCLV